jgi:predicted RNase H-like HicB family nuclease
MLRQYIQTAMSQAHYEMLDDDGTFVGTVPGFQGVYSNARTLEACRTELEEVLEEWLFLRISRGLAVPVVEGMQLVVKEKVRLEEACSA